MSIYDELRTKIKSFLKQEKPTMTEAIALIGALDLALEVLNAKIIPVEVKMPSSELSKKRSYHFHKDEGVSPGKAESFVLNTEPRGRENKP